MVETQGVGMGWRLQENRLKHGKVGIKPRNKNKKITDWKSCRNG